MNALLFRVLALAAALLVGFSSASLAGGLRFDPPAPDSDSFIRVTVGTMVNGCSPHGATITRAGSAITIRYPDPSPPGAGCGAMIAPWHETLPLGGLPPGTYDVVASVDSSFRGIQVIASGKLEVRDADAAFRLVPSVAPSGTPVFLLLPEGDSIPTSVAFDGVAVDATTTVYRSFDRLVAIVTPPPHARGIVDVVVNFNGGRSVAAAASFTYSDPAAPLDPFVFEPILFPISFEGPGAFGSQWQT